MTKVSLILIYNNELKLLIQNLNKILNHKKHIDELILVNASIDDQNLKFILNEAIENKIKYKIINSPNSYPGKSRNIGIKNAKNDIIAFLDIKTKPSDNWLENSLNELKINNYDYILGKTKYYPKTFIEKIISYGTYGNINHDTVPGSIFKKSVFKQIGLFDENVRAGEDIDFKKKLVDSNLSFTKSSYPLVYDTLENNIFKLLRKYALYSYHNSYLNIQSNSKLAYMFILSLFLLISTFSNSILNFFSLYSNIKLIVTIFIVFIILPNIYSLYLRYKARNFANVFFNSITILIIVLFIYNWNSFNYILENNYIIPHVTKISLLLIVLISIFVRGIFIPVKLNVDTNFIRKYFLLIGVIGTLINIAKAPGYILGYLINPFYLLNLKNFTFQKYNEIFHKEENKNILFVCPFPYGVQAGQRLKFEQFYPYIYNSHNIFISSFIDINAWHILYKRGFIVQKVISLLLGYFKRFLLYFYLSKFDKIYVFMWVVPYTSNFIEKMYRYKTNKIIYDIEDNILIIKKNEINPFNHFFKSQNKINYLIQNSDQIVASSPELSKKCNQISNSHKSIFISPAINLSRYTPKTNYKFNKKIKLGWTGTFTSKEYLETLRQCFVDLSLLINFKLIVISDFSYSIDGVDVESIIWSKNTEIEDLSKIDIGLYPLKKEQWVSGKSGLKAIQYMAMGIPTIATDYGNNKNIISNMENGILVNSEEEWKEMIIKLSKNYSLRHKLGTNGRKLIENNYSIEKIKDKYLKIIN